MIAKVSMATVSIISADSHFALAAALFAIALFGFWAERQSWGKVVTGAVWTLLLAILASNVGLIPKSAPFYNFVFQYFVPALIPLFLMDADVRRIISESGRLGLAFTLACVGSVSGALVGVSLLDLGTHESDLAGIFAATYIGGSVNYAALIQSTGFDDSSVISAATAVDSLMSAVFLALIAVMPASNWLMSRFAQRHHQNDSVVKSEPESSFSAYLLCGSVVFCLTVVALADGLVFYLNQWFQGFDFGSLRYIFITLLSVIPATINPAGMKKLQGGRELGLCLAFVFFAAICAGADVSKLIGSAPILLAFVTIILGVHFLVVFGGGWLLNKVSALITGREDNNVSLSLPELIIASNAAILGATTAPALAMARGWPGLVTPGILVGVAGYIVGTPLGIVVAAYWAH